MPKHHVPHSELAAKLTYLISRIHPPEREYTHTEIAAGILAKTGISLSPNYIGQLRAGKATNPSQRTLTALALFFGVPAEYFFDEGLASKVREEVELLAALRDATARNLALRVSQLTPEEVRSVSALVNHFLRTRGQEPDDAE